MLTATTTTTTKATTATLITTTMLAVLLQRPYEWNLLINALALSECSGPLRNVPCATHRAISNSACGSPLGNHAISIMHEHAQLPSSCVWHTTLKVLSQILYWRAR